MNIPWQKWLACIKGAKRAHTKGRQESAAKGRAMGRSIKEVFREEKMLQICIGVMLFMIFIYFHTTIKNTIDFIVHATLLFK